MSITELAARYRELEELSKAKSEELKKIDSEWTECETKLLEAFVDEGVNSVRLEGLGLFSMVTKNHLNVTAANKASYFEYLKATGNDGILKLDVNAKTNGAFLDSHLDTLIEGFMSEQGLDKVDARKVALEFLNKKGVSYFTEKRISVRKA